MTAVAVIPAGPLPLASGIRFPEGFTPANHARAAEGILRLAFATTDATSVGAVAVRPKAGADGGTVTVRAELAVDGPLRPLGMR
ncbi:hypothetical protein ACH47Z_39210 [Streptomyces sp. NPDC020192]|uniref:hypothetical protein n=1 Tax=Streptomyces sp. NPDC020192 TaxID=3365066 RepID=UPI003798A485